MWDRKELKAKGKAAFKRNYWPSVLVALVLGIVTGGSVGYAANGNSEELTQMVEGTTDPSMLIAILIGMLVGSIVATIIIILIDMFVINPLTVGGNRFFVRNSEENVSAGLLFSAYKDGNFGHVFKTMFLQDLYLMLWFLLLFIPGVIKSYSYRMVPYLIADHPEMSANEIITLSREMMNGNKWRAFVLDLSFIGWLCLTVLTFGLLGIFYVNPYMQATNAELYLALKK